MANPFGGDDGREAVDAIWVITTAFIIFSMQCGFGLIESGMVSRKSETNVILKNIIIVCLGGIAYWFVGYGFSFGPNTTSSNVMSGEDRFIVDVNMQTEAAVYAKFFFQLAFGSTATTIISGGVAERVPLRIYMILAVLNTGFIYVFPAHWMWDSNGWLAKNGAIDFAGSSVVHMSGGAASIVASIFLGPRVGRYDEKKKIIYSMASPTNVVLGTFFLWWGWIGFNCGSTFAMTGGAWKVASKVSVVTMLGAMGGGAAAIIVSYVMKFKRGYLLNISEFISGLLGGLVGITAPCAVIRPWEGLFIGFVGGLVALGFMNIMDKLQVDDPVGCFGVHWGAGLWSMIATGFFAGEQGSDDNNGIFRGGNGNLLAYNIAGSLAITVWSGGMIFIVLMVIKYTIGLRMSEEDEVKGTDKVEHNIVEANIVTLKRNQFHLINPETNATNGNYNGTNKLDDRKV